MQASLQDLSSRLSSAITELSALLTSQEPIPERFSKVRATIASRLDSPAAQSRKGAKASMKRRYASAVRASGQARSASTRPVSRSVPASKRSAAVSSGTSAADGAGTPRSLRTPMPSTPLRIALAQIDATVGAIADNRAAVLAAATGQTPGTAHLGAAATMGMPGVGSSWALSTNPEVLTPAARLAPAVAATPTHPRAAAAA